MTIIIDTREQQPILPPKGYKYTFKTLKAGDYSLQGHINNFAIERKSIADLFNTLTSAKNFKRFEKELNKLSYLKSFLLIEGTPQDIIFGYCYSNASGYAVLRKLFKLAVKYNLCIVFATNKDVARTVLLSICEGYLSSL